MTEERELDKYKTALANGYSHNQAEALAKWSLGDFVKLINNMIRSDEKTKEWVFKT